MTYLLTLLLLATALWGIRQWDRARHAERTLLEIAAHARSADDCEFASFQRLKQEIFAHQERGLGILRDDDRRPLASDENPAWRA